MIPEQTLLGFPLFGDNATKVEPDNNKKSNGWQQGDVVPAEWMNWEWYHASKGVADLNKGVSSMEKEINAVLASFGITPAEATNNQLLTAMRLNASFVTATGTTITGPLLVSGGTIRVLFTAAIAGNNITTGLSVSYNDVTVPVKVFKDGNLENFTAAKISETPNDVYRFLDAGATLELLYDGIQFIIVNNPIVLKASRYTIYADGSVGNGVLGDIHGFYKKDYYPGFLFLDGRNTTGTSEELSTYYPKLYAYLGTNVLPDYREFVLVGAERNTTSSVINQTGHSHDVFTQGQEKDDQLQNITGTFEARATNYNNNSVLTDPKGAFESYTGGSSNIDTLGQTSTEGATRGLKFDASRVARTGTTTRTKEKAVFWYIKAM